MRTAPPAGARGAKGARRSNLFERTTSLVKRPSDTFQRLAYFFMRL